MTVWALLDIKLIGRDLEHVVALDAYAVEDSADGAAGLAHGLHAGRVLIDGPVGGRLGGHGRILARGKLHENIRGQHPAETGEHP